MKKRIIKTVLPLLAFMLATAFAFATDQKSSDDEGPITGYIFKDDVCTLVPMNCNNQGSTLCTYNGSQVYSENNGTSCSDELYHRW